jgi:hypothetical protein
MGASSQPGMPSPFRESTARFGERVSPPEKIPKNCRDFSQPETGHVPCATMIIIHSASAVIHERPPARTLCGQQESSRPEAKPIWNFQN